MRTPVHAHARSEAQVPPHPRTPPRTSHALWSCRQEDLFFGTELREYVPMNGPTKGLEILIVVFVLRLH